MAVSEQSPAFPKVGDIVTFTAAKGSLALGLPVPVDSQFDPNAQTVAGTVVEVKPTQPHGPGKIPTAAVTVKGRTGAKVTIDGVACWLRVWPTMEDALAFVERVKKAGESFNRSTSGTLATAPTPPA